LRSETVPSIELGELTSELRLVVGRLARQLRRHSVGGLTPSQVSALISIAKHEPVRPGDLAGIEGVAAPTLSRIVAWLENEGLVERRDDPLDGRSALLSVTRKGRATLEEVRAAKQAMLRDRVQRLSDAERAVLAQALPVLASLLEDDRR